MSKTYCKGILVNDETREYSGCAGGEDCPVCKGKPFHHDDKCRYWDEGKFCDCGVWDLRYQQIAYESVIDRLKAELARYDEGVEVEGKIEYDPHESEYYLNADIDYDSELANQCYLNKYKPVPVTVLVRAKG